jgi:signal transduction histidine kinase
MTPAAWAATPVFLVMVAGTLQGAGVITPQMQAVIGPFEWLTYAILPIGLLIGVLRTRLGRAAVSDLVVALSRPPMTGTLRDLLARTLGDPGLELALALPDGSYIDSRGAGVALPAPSARRAVTVIDVEGRPLAALIHDPALNEDDPGLVAAAGSAARLALENERLQAEVRASLEEVRASRARIVEAADAERQRLERDIHDGAQQRLVALGVALKLARDHAATHGDDGLVAELEGATGQLKDALSELRDLAQGIHPAVLTRAGIGPALRVLAELSPIPVEIRDAPSERYPERVEAAVYFVVSEALANAAKHSGAHQVEVSVRRDSDCLSVDIRDDGVGGASADRGSGMVGMSDRVSVLGGRVEMWSPPGGGTAVWVRIPCE